MIEDPEDFARSLAEVPEEAPPKMISIGEIIRMCNEAGKKLSSENPHQYLFFLCAHALNELVERLAKAEKVQ